MTAPTIKVAVEIDLTLTDVEDVVEHRIDLSDLTDEALVEALRDALWSKTFQVFLPAAAPAWHDRGVDFEITDVRSEVPDESAALNL